MILLNKQFEKYSKIVCDTVNEEEGEIIGVKLLQELSKSKDGIGLAAPQLGITKQVCVINVKTPIVFVNPVIIKKSEETFVFPESCLSYPEKRIKTNRYVEITVEADNFEGQLYFSADSKDIKDAFECVCIQHEIDHLNGITMFDREFKLKPYVASKGYGRNEIVQIISADKTVRKKIKWKKAQPLINTGEWEIYTFTGGLT